ncbi:MAG: hypothetical protein DYG86_14890 [Chloroflexi bacterium CFX2]|nr:hypothetical protein [Chloroflexi bacterium CFX2]
MKTAMDILRFALGGFAGLLVISLIAEGIEFSLVTLVHREVTMDEQVYFGIRNQPWFLLLKFIYNGIALFVGGWLAARIVSRWKRACVLSLALAQTAAFIWGMTLSEYAGTTPVWAWILLAIEIPPAILLGGWKGSRI